jgi:U3 small nucleolar RNA-associated protein 3
VSDVEEAAFAEEQEALDIQKRMLATLQEDDFDLERFKLPVMEAEEQHEETQSVSRDISQLSEEEKREVLFKESPELFELIEDFKLSLSELKDKVYPLAMRSRQGEIPNPQGTEYLETKMKLLFKY